ncbi:MAG: hypothetical protein WB608_03865 [Terracidiphilus sp.]
MVLRPLRIQACQPPPEVRAFIVSRPGPGSLARRTHVRQLHLPPDNARHRDHHERGYDDDRADEDHGRLPPVTWGNLAAAGG